MKLFVALFATALGSRVDISAHAAGPTNELSSLRSDYDTFMQSPAGSGRMTSWTGDSTAAIVKTRRIHALIGHSPNWEVHKGATTSTVLAGMQPTFYWKSWFNPIANARRSVREGGKEGPTVNRIHYNQIRRARALVRAFITTPGNRKQTYYTMSRLGSKRHLSNGVMTEKKQTGTYRNGRTNLYNMGVGKCSGNMKTHGSCKGRLYTAKAFNFGYKIQVFKGDDMVAESEVADSDRSFADKYILGEKKRYDVKIKPGQDNMAVTEFIGFIADLEEWNVFSGHFGR